MSEPLPPVRKSVTVKRSPADAFRLFTEGIGRWWPMHTHSVGQADAVSVVMEPRPGGRLVERTRDGAEHEWGRVTAWEPPSRVVFTWHPGRGEDTAQEVEVRFTAAGDGARVDLEHRGWDVLGDDGKRTRDEYEQGWEPVFVQGFGMTASGAPRLSVLRHRPGRAWKEGVPFREQPGVEHHVEYMRSLDQRGVMVLGGPFLDGTGGMVVLEASIDEARQLANEDPSLELGLLEVDVRPWVTAMGRAR